MGCQAAVLASKGCCNDGKGQGMSMMRDWLKDGREACMIFEAPERSRRILSGVSIEV